MALAVRPAGPPSNPPPNRMLQQIQELPATDQNREGERMNQVSVPARCLSVTCPAARTLIAKPYQQTPFHTPALLPTAAGQLSMLLPSEYLHQPASAVAAKLAHTCSNHYKSSLTTCAFHPQTSRIVSGNKNGDMALWDLTNGFKYIKQWTAHHMTRLSALEWSHNEQYCITGDANGTVKYWLSTFQPHRLGLEGRTIHPDGGILDLAWAPSDTKFASASEDSTVCVWDLHTCKLQTRIEAHAGDCTSVHWHPTTSLLASCSRDTLVKLWDARAGKQVTTYHGHQDRVNVVRFHWNGNWLISGSRDASCKLFELRMNREMNTFTGHTKDINSIAWHPCVEQLFVTGSSDQSIMFWSADHEEPAHETKDAHNGMVTGVRWHPLGHLLCTIGSDAALKLWTRERPGDMLLGSLATGTIGQNQEVDSTPPTITPTGEATSKAAIPGLNLGVKRPVPPAGPPPGGSGPSPNTAGPPSSTMPLPGGIAPIRGPPPAPRAPSAPLHGPQFPPRPPSIPPGRGPMQRPERPPWPPHTPGAPPSGLVPHRPWNMNMHSGAPGGPLGGPPPGAHGMHRNMQPMPPPHAGRGGGIPEWGGNHGRGRGRGTWSPNSHGRGQGQWSK